MGTFGGGVAECGVFAETADAQAGDGGGDDYAGGVVDGGVLFKEGSESMRMAVSDCFGCGSCRDNIVGDGKTYSLIVLNTLLTFKSITFAKAPSGCVSNFSPHVAPAFAKRILTWSVVFETSFTSPSTSEIFALSAGTEMAAAPGRLFGRALRAAQACSQAAALREVM